MVVGLSKTDSSMVANGLRTVSSLSTESSTNSVSSTDGFTSSNNNNNNNNMALHHQQHLLGNMEGFSSVQEAISRINQGGFDEVSHSVED